MNLKREFPAALYSIVSEFTSCRRALVKVIVTATTIFLLSSVNIIIILHMSGVSSICIA